MTHVKVSCEGHLCKKRLQEKLQKLLAKVPHDTLASCMLKVA